LCLAAPDFSAHDGLRADEGDEDVLTHLGSSLAELDGGADDFVPSDGVRSRMATTRATTHRQLLFFGAHARPPRPLCPAQDDEELNDLITREYHFGGGLFTRKAQQEGGEEAAPDGGEEPQRKTKKEVCFRCRTKRWRRALG
jgi:hypothetical protein